MRHIVRLALAVSVAVLLLGLQRPAFAQSSSQPYLGFCGETVRLPAYLRLPSKARGMYVYHVHRGTPAAEAGLESGDIVVTIDGMGFRTRAGYLKALRYASQRPSLVVVDVRTGRLVRVSCRFPHKQERRRLDGDPFPLIIDLISDMRGCRGGW